jgi:hypothetical protein
LTTLPRLPSGIDAEVTGNPWNDAFATILYGDSEEDWLGEGSDGYLALSHDRIQAIHAYHDRMERKARFLGRAHCRHLLSKHANPDILAWITAFLTGSSL